MTSNCTGINAHLLSDGIQGVMGENSEWHLLWDEAIPLPGAVPVSVETQTAQPAAGSIPEIQAARITAPQIHSSPLPLGNICHLLAHSCPPWRYFVCENQG